MRTLVLHRQRDREEDARKDLLEAAVLCLDQERQLRILNADALDGNAARICLVLYVAHQISLVS